MLKYEQRSIDNRRQLLVKNITQKEIGAEFYCEAKGEKCKAKLNLMSPWVRKVENITGFIGGIAVLQAIVKPATQVTWYIKNQKINKNTFR